MSRLNVTAVGALVIILVSAFSPRLRADSRHYLITTEDGLSNSSVNCILQDAEGLMWFGTWEGLNVYDGNRLKVFRNNPMDENSLLDNIVRNVVQEDRNHFWVVTAWGVSRLDVETGKFSRYRLVTDQISSFAGEGVSLTIAADGTVFCSSNGWGLAYYDKVSERMVPFKVRDYPTSGITGVGSDGEGNLIVIGEGGEVVRISYSFDDKQDSIDARAVETVLSPQSGSYLMASSKDRIFFVGTRHIFEYDRLARAVVDSVSFSGTVSYAAMSPDGHLDMVADRTSLCRVDFESGRVFRIDSFSRDNLLSFCYGTQDIVWLGVDGEGVEACLIEPDPMRKISSKSLFALRGGAVTSMVQTEGGDIYTSVLGNGMCLMDSLGNPKKKINISASDEGNYIFSMSNGPENSILLGVRNAVELYFPSSGDTYVLHRFSKNPPVIAYCMYYDEECERLWVGTLGDGLIRLDLERDNLTGCRVRTMIRYSHDKNDKNSLSGDSVMHIAPASDGGVWVGTLGGGLNHLDVDNGLFKRIAVGEDIGNIPSNNVRFVVQDDTLSIWVGTSYGLSHGTRSHEGEWAFTLYDAESGLSDNTVQAIVKDGEGNIWISTNNGLSMLDPVTGKFSNYTNTRSLQGKEFYINSYLKAQNGEIFFGGVGGLNHFFPQDLKPRDFSPRIFIENLAVSTDNVKSTVSGKPVTLRYNENFFSITFSALEYIGNSDCEYSYILSGFSGTWVTVPSGTPAMFTNVPPGKYTFMVRSTNGDKVWCDNVQSLEVVIRKPWYLTFWAISSYSILLLSMALAIIRFYRDRAHQKRLLAMETAEKQAQKETYEAKLTFFTNIAHEFGTPLTLISCSGERLESEPQNDSRARRYVKIINDNAARMQRLIQELLEFRKVEAGSYDFSFSEVEPVSMLRSILSDFEEVGDKHRIDLKIEVGNPECRFVSDAGALEKIFLNLISNAYKYTPDGGTVSVRLSGMDGGIQFEVTNTSKGLSDEKLSRVFDRFVILDNLERQMAKGRVVRNGIGMALFQSLVKALGGDIKVSSVAGESVTFTFFLPSCHSEIMPQTGLRQREYVRPDLEPDRLVESLDTHVAVEGDGKPVVMIVDDEPQICEMVSDVLEGDYHTIKASDGSVALRILEAVKVDLVITDINMPVMDGAELLRRMKGNDLTRFIPVVILAMKTDVADEINSYNLGSEAFIPKPFLPAQLTAVVSGILRKRSGLKNYYNSSASDQEMFYGVQMSSKDRRFMADVVNLVEENITDELSPDEVASRLCVSEMTLYRKVKGITGKSPGEFVRNVRLKHAARLLRTTTLTVQEVMFDSGFNNKSWFYRKFQEMFGMSPKEYRDGK